LPERVDVAAPRQKSPEWVGTAEVRYPQIINKNGVTDTMTDLYAGTSTSRW